MKKASKKNTNNDIYFIPEPPMADIDTSVLPPVMRPYQVDGVRFLEALNGTGIIADEMRLGKSLQALGYAFIHPEKRPVLIVCPASAKIGWQREIAKWSTESSIILQSRQTYMIPPSMSFVIINYDILSDWEWYLKTISFSIMIVDECHYLATPHTLKKVGNTYRNVPVQRTAAFLSLSEHIPHIIPLSGTPITRAPSQFFTVLNVIRPDLFPNRRAYYERFCDPKMGYRHKMTYDGITNVNKLRALLARCMIRRRKSEVFEFLPIEEKIIVPLVVDKEQYAKDAEEYEKWFKEHVDASEEEIERRLSLMKSVSYDAKRPQIIEWIKDYMLSGKKIVLFGYNRDVCLDLHKTFKKDSVLVYGGMGIKERQNAIDSFQTDPDVLLFIGQIEATNTAISLSASDTVAFIQLPMTAGSLKQAQERIFIPNDGKQRLTYYYLVMGDTMDETRAVNLQNRANILGSVLDGVNSEPIFGSDIKKEFKGKK